MLVFTLRMKITHWLSLWLKYTVKWTSNSISVWLRKWLPPFSLAHACFGNGWQFSVCSHWPKSHTPHCLDSWQMELGGGGGRVCMCVFVLWVWHTQTKDKNRQNKDEEARESLNHFQICCHFPIVLFYFLKPFFSAMDGCVIFFIVVELQEKHWQFWRDHEARRISWGKYSHVFCKNFLILFS